ncbi:Hypothetical protein IALB_1642 [Ignavibacterium album JCM 16511]|uniref:NHL repeat protein n=1 Tax=Ignavibacterium album (strain DSM 19864 / JCM 16511 / NBRC 101810 / Mat9-16) TaxID=945713 RepID=I0AK43_IGNAJ|nr:hypothetical protein [Ignavibacterium album]AFH49350.1 Hypothetical protein IALB_1642 [Ignavibacterium album JCM 16511]
MNTSINKILISILLLTLVLLFLSCEDKFELPTTSGLGNITGDTVYVQLNPPWEGFNNPQDIYIGNEPFIYVADTDNDRIVMMNLAGTILGSRTIKKPVALAQDYQLNLIVCSEFDTLGSTFGAVYKINLVAANHNISEAPITRLLPRPNVPSDLKTGIRYTGVAVFYDNSFYIARTGPNNSSIFDPDNSILIFQKKLLDDGSKKDTLIGRLPSIEPVGTGLLTAFNISSLASFKKRNTDFVMTLTGNTTFKTQWLYFNFASETPGYESKLSPGTNQMMSVNKFSRPEGVTVDNSGNIYVADAGRDSVYKFNSFGDELQSFGGPQLFNQPYAVAYFDKTLYVVDKGNNRILRFILSTDLR